MERRVIHDDKKLFLDKIGALIKSYDIAVGALRAGNMAIIELHLDDGDFYDKEGYVFQWRNEAEPHIISRRNKLITEINNLSGCDVSLLLTAWRSKGSAGIESILNDFVIYEKEDNNG